MCNCSIEFRCESNDLASCALEFNFNRLLFFLQSKYLSLSIWFQCVLYLNLKTLTVRLCWHYQFVRKTLWFLWYENRLTVAHRAWPLPKSLPVNRHEITIEINSPCVFCDFVFEITFNRSYSVPCSFNSFWVASTEFGNSVSWITRMNMSKLHDTWCVRLENFSKH